MTFYQFLPEIQRSILSFMIFKPNKEELRQIVKDKDNRWKTNSLKFISLPALKKTDVKFILNNHSYTDLQIDMYVLCELVHVCPRKHFERLHYLLSKNRSDIYQFTFHTSSELYPTWVSL